MANSHPVRFVANKTLERRARTFRVAAGGTEPVSANRHSVQDRKKNADLLLCAAIKYRWACHPLRLTIPVQITARKRTVRRRNSRLKDLSNASELWKPDRDASRSSRGTYRMSQRICPLSTAPPLSALYSSEPCSVTRMCQLPSLNTLNASRDGVTPPVPLRFASAPIDLLLACVDWGTCSRAAYLQTHHTRFR
eukprot:COSAG06_NODE_34_length_31045_cov_28.806469_26_plen_194_part_00